jgi:hypothetical protein
MERPLRDVEKNNEKTERISTVVKEELQTPINFLEKYQSNINTTLSDKISITAEKINVDRQRDFKVFEEFLNKNYFDKIDTRFTPLEDGVAVLKTDVADLKTDVADLTTGVADLKTDVADLKTDVGNGLNKIQADDNSNLGILINEKMYKTV